MFSTIKSVSLFQNLLHQVGFFFFSKNVEKISFALELIEIIWKMCGRCERNSVYTTRKSIDIMGLAFFTCVLCRWQGSCTPDCQTFSVVHTCIAFIPF